MCHYIRKSCPAARARLNQIDQVSGMGDCGPSDVVPSWLPARAPAVALNGVQPSWPVSPVHPPWGSKKEGKLLRAVGQQLDDEQEAHRSASFLAVHSSKLAAESEKFTANHSQKPAAESEKFTANHSQKPAAERAKSFCSPTGQGPLSDENVLDKAMRKKTEKNLDGIPRNKAVIEPANLAQSHLTPPPLVPGYLCSSPLGAFLGYPSKNGFTESCYGGFTSFGSGGYGYLLPSAWVTIYEDKNMGILCYTDENGELICEGLDEGPRLTWQDMEKLNMEKQTKKQEDQRQRTMLPIVGTIDWRSLQAAVSMGKN